MVSEEQKKQMQRISSLIFDEEFSTSKAEEISQKTGISSSRVSVTISILIETGELIKIEEGIYIHKKRIKEAEEKIRDFFTNNQTMKIGDFRKILNTSRKYAMPLINYFDSAGLTVRQEDVRVINPDY